MSAPRTVTKKELAARLKAEKRGPSPARVEVPRAQTEAALYPSTCDACGESVTGPEGGVDEGGFMEQATKNEDGTVTRKRWCRGCVA